MSMLDNYFLFVLLSLYYSWYHYCCSHDYTRSLQTTTKEVKSKYYFKYYKQIILAIGFWICFIGIDKNNTNNNDNTMMKIKPAVVMAYTLPTRGRRYYNHQYLPSRLWRTYQTTNQQEQQQQSCYTRPAGTTIRPSSTTPTKTSLQMLSSLWNHHDYENGPWMIISSYSSTPAVLMHTSSWWRRRRRQSSSLSMTKPTSSSSSFFEQGDYVYVLQKNGNQQQEQQVRGIVTEIRGSGWYAVEIQDTNGSTSTIKCRGGNLEKWNPTTTTTATTNNTNNNQRVEQGNQQIVVNDDNDSSSILSILKNNNASSQPPPPSSSTNTEQSTQTQSSSSSPPPPPLPLPSITNLDRRMKSYQDRRLASQIMTSSTITKHQDDEYMEQCLHHASHGKWIIFSDLHVSPSTLPTTLQVLDHVHQVAMEKSAGILFLGDFWHHRGTIRIDCLNAILLKLKTTYKVPMICIPGNHDQVTLGLSSNHGLTPLENSYRIPLKQKQKSKIVPPPPATFSSSSSKSETTSSSSSSAAPTKSKQELKSFSSPPPEPPNFSFLKKDKDNESGRTLPSFLDKHASKGMSRNPNNRSAAAAAAAAATLEQQQQQEQSPKNEEGTSSSSPPSSTSTTTESEQDLSTTTTTSITSIPGPLIFSNPTKFGNAFFVPHIRDINVMQSVLQSAEALTSQAIFVHADITGAYMNDMILSKGGISPTAFPSTISTIYSGHFHKPHTITSKIKTKTTPISNLSSLSALGGLSTTSSPSSTTTRTIQYVGSPYQTSLSEANQSKELFLVDAKQGWQCIERIPIHIGRKHYRFFSIQEFLQRNTAKSNNNGTMVECVQPKDRVVISVKKEVMDEVRLLKKTDSAVVVDENNGTSTASHRQEEEKLLNEFDIQVKALRKLGATVEIREVVHQSKLSRSNSGQDAERNNVTEPAATTRKGGDIEKDLALFTILEEMTPQTTLLAYLDGELHREALTNNTVDTLKKAGLTMMAELGQSDEESSPSSNTHEMTKNDEPTHLCLDSVDIEGFGPFRDLVSYPLKDRGLVLVRGCNKDGGADSNGSGKTSLAMAALWALTGTIDPRPLQDSKVSDVVNDQSETAKVSINGTLNGEEFVITRTKNAASKRGGSGLSFHLGGEELSAQSAKDTQLVIDEKLGVGTQVLARTIFHGQHAVNGLLEATDGKLKEELSLIVPLNLWQEAASLARAKSRTASQKAAEVSGMISLRSKDVEELVRRRDASNDIATKKRAMYNEKENRAKTALKRIETTLSGENKNNKDVDLDEMKSALDAANEHVLRIESHLQNLKSERNLQVVDLATQVKQLSSATNAEREKLQEYQRKYDRAEVMLDSARANLQLMEEKWNINLAEGEDASNIVLPDICPTCLQPINDDSEDHKHKLREKAEAEVGTGKEKYRLAQADMQLAKQALDIAVESLSGREEELQKLSSELQELSLKWDEQLESSEDELKQARGEQLLQSQQYSQAISDVQQLAEVKSLEVSLAAELELVESTEAAYKELCEDTKRAQDLLVDLSDKCELEKTASATASQLATVFGPRGVQTFVLQNAIKALQTTSQSYLDELSDGSQKLELALDAGERIVRRAFVQNADGTFVERPLSSLSGGQWRRCSMAINLGFADLVARRGRMRPSLFVLDEPLTHLDQTGRAQVGKMLRQLLHRNPENAGAFDSGGLQISTILIILQDLAAEELEESFDHIDQVVKEGGQSRVDVDELS